MRLVLDVENTTQTRNGKLHLDPYEEGNFLVQVGMQNADNKDETFIVNIDHVEAKDTSGSGRKLTQGILDMTTLLIMHNAICCGYGSVALSMRVMCMTPCLQSTYCYVDRRIH